MSTGTFTQSRQLAPEPLARSVPATPSLTSDIIDVKELLRTLWRRRTVIIGTTLFVTSLAVLYTSQVTPRYTASALLTLQTRHEAVVDIQAVMSGLMMDNTAVILTELDLLSSRRLIGKLVDKLQLANDPEFNGALGDKKPSALAIALDPKTYIPPDWLMALGLSSGDEDTMTEEERRSRERASVVNAVTAALSATNPELSYTINLSFVSEDPKKAALLTNTLANIYLTDQLEAKFEATQRATNWLSERIGDLRAKVAAAEGAVENYRAQHKLIQTSGQGTVSEQQLSQLNVQLITAQTALAEAEARYSQVKTQSDRRGNAASLGEVLKSPLIQSLSEQEAQVRRRLADITKRYGPRHPETARANSELSDIRSKISEEIAKVTESVEAEVRVARARVSTLASSLDALKRENAALDRSRIELRELEREAQSSRVLLETFLARFKETSNQEDLQQADARIISEAEIPAGPSYPKKNQIIAIAFAISLVLGLGLAFLLEALDSGFRALEHLERLNKIKGLGMIPKLTSLKLKGMPPFNYALAKPTSAYSESLRSLYTNLMFGGPGEAKTKIIMVTSALPGEGKTTLSLSLSMLLNKAGSIKVLYIETDLRRSNAAKIVTDIDKTKPSITQYLTGAVEHWEECLNIHPASGLHLITAGGKTDYPQTLLQSERMRALIVEAYQRYDLILLDAPPLLAVSDAVILSHFVDAIIFAVRWEFTARDAVRNALELLRKAGAPIGGAVLTQVDVKRHAYYGYGDYASYYGRYGSYYTN